LGLVKLITRDDCGHPFLSFKYPRVYHIAKNRWLSVTIQNPRTQQDKDATEKPKNDANNALTGTAPTSLNSSAPPPVDHLLRAGPNKDAISINDDDQSNDTVKEKKLILAKLATLPRRANQLQRTKTEIFPPTKSSWISKFEWKWTKTLWELWIRSSLASRHGT
jgi:hypothetical protein